LLYGIERGFYREEGIDLVYVSLKGEDITEKEGTPCVTAAPQERMASSPILPADHSVVKIKYCQQKGNECQFARIAMLAGETL
jgi:hypothetical protein